MKKSTLLVLGAVAVAGFVYVRAKRNKTLAQQVAEGKITATEARMLALSRGPGATSQVDGLGSMGAFGFPWLRNLSIHNLSVKPFAGVLSSGLMGRSRGRSGFSRTIGMRG